MGLITYQKAIFFSLIILLIGFTFLFSGVVLAQNTLLPNTSDLNLEKCGNCKKGANVDPRCKQYCGNYKLNDFIELAIQFSQILLGLTGSLALLAFVYGGVMFLISAGSRERVEQAKKIITGAVVGIIIVFASYIIIGFIFSSFGITNWATSDWF